jgi:hypothetical protein
MATPIDTKVHCIVIPDGGERTAAGKTKLRFSVLLTPAVGACEGSATVNFLDWTDKIANSSLSLSLWMIDAGTKKPKGPPLTFPSSQFDNWGDNGKPRSAAALQYAKDFWSEVIAVPGSVKPYLGAALARMFGDPDNACGDDASQSLSLKSGNHVVDPVPAVWFSHRELRRSLTGLKQKFGKQQLDTAAVGDEVRAMSAGGGKAVSLSGAFADKLFTSQFADLFVNASAKVARPVTVDAAAGEATTPPSRSSFAARCQEIKNSVLGLTPSVSQPAQSSARDIDMVAEALAAPPSALDRRFQQLVDSASAIDDAASAIQDQITAFHKTVPIEKPPPNSPPPPANDEEGIALAMDILARKLAAVRSYPTLSRFLGFTLDVDADFDDVPQQGYLAAGIFDNPNPDLHGLDWTAFNCSASNDGVVFVAAPRGTASVDGAADGARYTQDIPFDHGVALLGDDRFEVDIVEPTQLMHALVQQSGAHFDAQESGNALGSSSLKFPEIQASGFHVYDALGANRNLEKFKRSLDIRTARKAAKMTVFFAEDLYVGLRIDAQRTNHLTGQPGDWLTLTARVMEIHQISDAFGSVDQNWHPYRKFEDRDHGYVHMAAKLIPADESTKTVAPSEVLFAWAGTPLGAPSEQDRDINPDPLNDLGVHIDYNYSSDFPMPKLRVGDSYCFGARAVMVNGASVPLALATKTYKRRDSSSATKPFVYRYVDDTHAPTVMLPENEPLAAGNGKPNERDDRIVLRTGQTISDHRTTRFLAPARTTFERAEQFGLLDTPLQTGSTQPRGAFLDFERTDTGDFPKTGPSPKRVTGSLVRQLGAPVTTEKHPYFPDPKGRNASFILERDGLTPPGFDLARPSRAFWNQNESALDARPLLLEVTAGAQGGFARFDPSEGTQLRNNYVAPKLSLSIAPAESVRLWYWAWPDPDAAARDSHHADAIFDKSGKPWSASELGTLTALLKAGPVNGFGGWGTLEIVHAVEKPLAPPRFEHSGPAPLASAQFAVARLPPGVQPDDRSVSARGGTRGYFSGAALFDRLSTGEMRLEAAWRDLSDKTAVRYDKSNGEWRWQPGYSSKLLFHVAAIDVDRGVTAASKAVAAGEAADFFDITRDEAGRRRNLFYEFGDTAAHRLSLRLVATSRFVREFKELPGQRSDRFEQVSRGEIPGNADVDAAPPAYVWLPATERPPKPEIDHIGWVTAERSEDPGDRTRKISNICYPRVYLARPWYVSGEDELVAVILAPAETPPSADPGYDPATAPSSYFDPLPASSVTREDAAFMNGTFDDPAVSPVSEIVTRWGRDPTTTAITDTNALWTLVPPQAFRGHVGRRAKLPLPWHEKPSQPPPALSNVSVVLYRPSFDQHTGSWYVDIAMEAMSVAGSAPHMPFVRLALARFQPHALKGLELSEPVILNPIQLRARRTMTAEIEGQSVEVSVQGNAYQHRAPFARDESALKDHILPRMNAVLRRKTRAAGGGSVASFDEKGESLRMHQIKPVPNSADANSLTWKWAFQLPAGSTPQDYTVRFDEVELHIPDSVLDASTPPPEVTFVERPAMFSGEIDLS